MKMKKIALLVAALYLPAAGAAYRCIDEKGQRHIGDTPPPGCATVPMEEFKGSKVLRVIEPTLTPEQVKVKEEEAARKKAADRIAAEQKRKDAALLSTFSSEKEFDVTRDRTVEPITGRIKTAKERIAQIEKHEKKLSEEMEFYQAGKGKGKAKEAPANLVDGLKGAQQEKATIQKNIAGYEKEIQEIRAKFDEDKKRWIAIKAEQAKPAAAATTAATAAAPAKPAAPKKN
jgi:predicted  nucleic acid-binding Zn-ribbon protein